MTTRGPCIVVTLLGCVLAVATSVHAESAWMLWQQATVFTERRWIPKGWPAHRRTTEMPGPAPPRGRRTHVARGSVLSRRCP
jgi:hypothetical protein